MDLAISFFRAQFFLQPFNHPSPSSENTVQSLLTAKSLNLLKFVPQWEIKEKEKQHFLLDGRA
jgi:hypothetical protein